MSPRNCSIAAPSSSSRPLSFKGAFVDGEALDARNANELSKMPNRAEMHGRLAATVLAPGAKVAGAILSPGSKIAGCLKSLIEKQEKAA